MELLTYSAMGQFKNCRKAFYYRNVLSIVPRIEKESRGIGSAVHKGIETGSIEEALRLFDNIFPSDQEEADKLEINKAIVHAMLEGYFNLYGSGFPEAEERYPEFKFKIPIVNPKTKAKSKSFMLAGKVDDLIKTNNEWWLVEYKTAGTVDKSYIDKLMLDTQITTYIYAIQKFFNIKISGVIYRILRKPSIRQTKKETVSQFIDRLMQDYKDRPEFYFYEEKLYRSQEDLNEFEAELWDITQDLLKCRKEGLWYKNTSRCKDWGKCEYIPLCACQPDAIELFKEKEINSELKEDEEYASVAS